MEALSGITFIVNFVALADNIFRGVRFLRRAFGDPRADALYVRLITEQARYAEWKRRMGIENERDVESLLTKIPDNARESLTIILAPMEKYLRESQLMFQKYGIEKPGDDIAHRTWQNKLKRVDFMIDGQRELTVLLNTLKDCNDGLLTIAPPAPGYYVSLASNDPILEMSQPTHQVQSREHAQPRHIEPSMASEDIASQQNESRGAEVFRSVTELLYSTSLDILRTSAVRYSTHEPIFKVLLERLSLWGSGMFHGPISIDQAFNQQSDSVSMLKNNVAAILAEIAIALEYMLSVLGEPTDSASVLRLQGLFSIPEISQLPLRDDSSDYDQDIADEQPAPLECCTQDLSELIECLFHTLPTIEVVINAVRARQTQNPALDERAMLLLNSESSISLSNMGSGPAKELLKVDLELIAAMRESLKDTKYVKYMEAKEPDFNAKQLYEELEEGSAQVKYWTSKLAEEKRGITKETETAMTLNLARIAHAFKAGYPEHPSDSKMPVEADRIQNIIRQCLLNVTDDDDETMILEPIGDGDTISALDVLKSSNMELRRLAGSQMPGMSYQEDFSLSGKEREALKPLRDIPLI